MAQRCAIKRRACLSKERFFKPGTADDEAVKRDETHEGPETTAAAVSRRSDEHVLGERRESSAREGLSQEGEKGRVR